MLILAMESSAKPVSVAVYDSGDKNYKGKLLGQLMQNDGVTHSRTLLELTRRLLRGLSLNPSQIDLFAVASGPGSFTGVRIGVCAAKGLAFGLDAPVCGVSTLEAMAWQSLFSPVCCAPGGGSAPGGSIPGSIVPGDGAIICPVMDARRGQVYNAVFASGGNAPIRLREDRALSIKELAADLAGIVQSCENAMDRPVLLTGDGADIVYSEFKGSSNLTINIPDSDAKYQSAYGVALAAATAKPVSASGLMPVYLRVSQAERLLKESSLTAHTGK